MELKTIEELFEKKIFRIPSYQRGYSWTNKKVLYDENDIKEKIHDVNGQLIDLWKDIINITQDKWHYLGLLTLASV